MQSLGYAVSNNWRRQGNQQGGYLNLALSKKFPEIMKGHIQQIGKALKNNTTASTMPSGYRVEWIWEIERGGQVLVGWLYDAGKDDHRRPNSRCCQALLLDSLPDDLDEIARMLNGGPPRKFTAQDVRPSLLDDPSVSELVSKAQGSGLFTANAMRIVQEQRTRKKRVGVWAENRSWLDAINHCGEFSSLELGDILTPEQEIEKIKIKTEINPVEPLGRRGGSNKPFPGWINRNRIIVSLLVGGSIVAFLWWGWSEWRKRAPGSTGIAPGNDKPTTQQFAPHDGQQYGAVEPVVPSSQTSESKPAGIRPTESLPSSTRSIRPHDIGQR